MNPFQFKIRRFGGLLRRQFRLLIGVVILMLGLATIALTTTKPVYLGTALVLVDPAQRNLLEGENRGAGDPSEDARIASEVEIIRAQSTLLGVIERFDLVDSEEFGVSRSWWVHLLDRLGLVTSDLPTGDKALYQVLGNVGEALDVRQRDLTNLITINFQARSPERAAEIANAIAEAYIADQLADKVKTALAVREILNARITDANAAIARFERSLNEVIFSNIDRIVSQTGNTDLALLQARLDSVARDRVNAEQSAQLLDQNIRQDNWQSLSASLGLETLAALELERETLEAQIAGTRAGTQLALDREAALVAVEQQLTESALSELNRLRQRARDAGTEGTELRNQIRNTVLSGELPADLMAETFQLQQSAGLARTRYQSLLSRLREVETEVNLQTADSRIISRALPPERPIAPNGALILALASVMGLGAGVGLAYLNEKYIGGFTSRGQIEAVLKHKVVADIPLVKARTSKKDSVIADAIIKAPRSGFSENVRRVRLDIDRAIRQRERHHASDDLRGFVAMVCSAMPGEGKTSIALALARTYALSGQRTLLIDADMRQPSVHKLLGLNVQKGLFDYLHQAGIAPPMTQIFSKDPLSVLDVIVGTPTKDAPTDQLLASKRFATVIDSATRHFDVIIIDTPAAKTLVDGIYLAQHANYLAFVVQWSKTAQSDVRAAMAHLFEALPEQAMVGMILNQRPRAATRVRGKKDITSSGHAEAGAVKTNPRRNSFRHDVMRKIMPWRKPYA